MIDLLFTYCLLCVPAIALLFSISHRNCLFKLFKSFLFLFFHCFMFFSTMFPYTNSLCTFLLYGHSYGFAQCRFLAGAKFATTIHVSTTIYVSPTIKGFRAARLLAGPGEMLGFIQLRTRDFLTSFLKKCIRASPNIAVTHRCGVNKSTWTSLHNVMYKNGIKLFV